MIKQYFLAFSGDPKIDSKLFALIKELSASYGGPVFMPHLTILSSVRGEEKEIHIKTKELAGSINPIKAELGEISYSTTHFQNIFVRVKANPEIMNAHLLAREIFGLVDKNAFYMPHISLLYGDQDMQQRQIIANSLNFKIEPEYLINKIMLVPYADSPTSWQSELEINLS
jgi:2'-5' RNA ligase